MAAAAGILVGVLGSGLSVLGQMKQAKAAANAEKARQAQMNLEAMRKRREIIREAQVAKASATSNASAQGGSESSALQGGISQITTQANRNIAASNQDQSIGNLVFKANKDYGKAGTLVAFGGGLQDLGSSIGKLGNLGTAAG